jgi:rhodanese-related sulfurtransferase
LIPIGEFVTELPKRVKNKDGTILIYCRKGIRAEASAKIAERLGYTNVYWLDGTYDELSKLI